MTSTSHTDASVRALIGPWSEAGIADLGAFDMDTNFVVRAAAGSGKTTALVARMVALVRRGVDVGSIAAITFTKKAAAEMNARFYEELGVTMDRLSDGPERENVRQALDDIRNGYVGTIDAFCARILRENPLAVGLPPDFTSGLDDREEREIRAIALEAYLGKVYSETPDRLLDLADMGVDTSRLPEFFDTLCKYPELELYADGPDAAPDMEKAVRQAVEILDRCRQQRPESLPHGLDAAMRAFDRAEGMLRQSPFETPAEQATFLELFDSLIKDGKADFKFKCWADRKEEKEAYAAAQELAKETLPHFVENTVRPPLRRWSALVHRAVVDLMGPAVAYYREARREQGKLTYHDVLYYTRELLRADPRIRARIQERFQYFLVDEFQDTDPLQTQILFYLTGSNPKETDWEKCIPGRGSLFIVGDDKQSIYRFRRADKDVFDEVAGLVEATGGEVVDLTRNFRSLGAICGWCNDAFEALFCDPVVGDIQAGYVPLQAHRTPGADAHGLRRIVIGKKGRNNASAIARDDAGQIARFIRGACDGKCDELTGGQDAVFNGAGGYSDFLILTRRKSRLQVYANALAAHNIPYTVTGSQDMGKSPELRALVELLTCALRPDDPVAAVAYLRGGLCGFGDDDLFQYHLAGGAFDEMLAAPSDDARAAMDSALGDRFADALERVRQTRRLLASTHPGLAIERLLDETGLLAAAAHPESGAGQGSLRAGQLLRPLILVRELTSEGKDWAEIVESLRLIVQGDEAIDGMTLETGSGSAVRIMNVHQAKGLQAPVVFLADPYSSYGNSHKPDKHVLRDRGELAAPVMEGDGFYATLTHAPLGWYDRSESEPGFDTLETRHELAEEHRLLYVAATRAKNLLVVSTYPEEEHRGYWSGLYAHLDRAEVPPLSIPEVEQLSAAPAPAPDLGADRTSWGAQLARVAVPGYSVSSVTMEKSSVEALSADGYGTEFGIALHSLIELMAQHGIGPAQLSAVPIDNICKLHGFESGQAEAHRIREMAARLLESDLWGQILSADELYTEYPVMTVSRSAPPVLTRANIDLVYRTDEGWHIIDFKSDKIDNAEDVARLPPDHSYVRQVQSYAGAWEAVSGEPVAQAGLWFADAGLYHEVPAAERRHVTADLFPQP